jgi:hypothetical protein
VSGGESNAGWHPDPSGAHEHRYWDGNAWTDHVADRGVASTDPIPALPRPPLLAAQPPGASTTPFSSFSPLGDARTQPKAEKAYAVANRPWYRKKRWWAVAIVAVVVIAAAAFSRGNQKTNAAAQPPTKSSPGGQTLSGNTTHAPTKSSPGGQTLSGNKTHPPPADARAAATASSGVNNQSSAGAQPPTKASTKSSAGGQTLSGNPTPPPQADVRVTGCTYEPTSHIATAKLTILNHSSDRSDYSISVVFEDSHRAQLGSTDVSGGAGVAPGQTAVVAALYPLSAAPDRVQCVVKSVNRFASN